MPLPLVAESISAALPNMGRLHPKSHFLDVHLANANSHGRAISTSTTTTTTTTTTTLISATPASYFAGAPKPNYVPLRLAPREENTRVQLQKQRLQDQHSKQLVSPPNIPGFKTSAGEFSLLESYAQECGASTPDPSVAKQFICSRSISMIVLSIPITTRLQMQHLKKFTPSNNCTTL